MSLKCHKLEIYHKHAVKNAQNFRNIWNCVTEPHMNVPSSDLRGGTVELEAQLLCVREVPGSNLAPQTGCSHRFFVLFLHSMQVLESICPRPLPCTPFTASLCPKVWVRSLLRLPPITNASLIFLLTQERVSPPHPA